LEEMEQNFGLDVSYELGDLTEKLEELKIEQEQEYELNQDYYKEQMYERRFEEREIDQMFESFKYTDEE